MPRHSPMIGAGILIGAGMGGFVDGIVFHQILQWHNMLSAQLPPVDVVSIKVNMLWDGLFHAGVWIMSAVGIALLWRAGTRTDTGCSERRCRDGGCSTWSRACSITICCGCTTCTSTRPTTCRTTWPSSHSVPCCSSLESRWCGAVFGLRGRPDEEVAG
jgi:hypothetical protein